MNQEIHIYNNKQAPTDMLICETLSNFICEQLPEAENKIWHGHPVWFLDGNPIVGYDKLKDAVRLMFWSGASFEESELKIGTGKFKDASIRYTNVQQINLTDLERWIEKSKTIQWDYKNVVKRKGVLEWIGK